MNRPIAIDAADVVAGNKLAPVKRWVGKSKQWTESFLESLKDNQIIKCVVILGSAIRPRGHRRSDFDLLIVYDGNQRPRIAAPIEVDVRRYGRDNLDKKVSQADEVVCWALMFGIAVYDPERVWAETLEKYRSRIPLPSQTEAQARARKSLDKAYDMLDLGDEHAAADLILASLTQFVRRELIARGVFPASRPELPGQLREVSPGNALAGLLEDAMYGNTDASSLCDAVSHTAERR